MARDPRFGPDDVRLGHVSGLHGIQGEVKLFLYNPGSDLADDGARVQLVGPDGQRRTVDLRVRPGAGRRILARIAGVQDRDQARALHGWEIVVDRRQLPEPGPGEWYHRDLVGLPVRTVSGRELGAIREIHATGEVDVWVLRGPEGERVMPVLLDRIVQVRTRPQTGDDGQELDAAVIVTDDAVEQGPIL